MATFENQQYTKEMLLIDGHRYEECVFTNCTLTYEGGELPAFINCQFPGTRVQLAGAASQTITYLSGLYKGGFSKKIEPILEGVQRGVYPPEERPKPPPPGHTGINFRELYITHAVLIGGTLLLIFAIWYSYITYPFYEILDEGQPLFEEFPLEAMPALPDSLAEQYDLRRDEQLALLDSYGWVDEEAQIVHIPVTAAFDLLIEQQSTTTDEETE